MTEQYSIKSELEADQWDADYAAINRRTHMAHTFYRVNWDNGAEACGTFPYTFSSEQDAEDFGNDWVAEMTAVSEPDPDYEDGYSFEIIEENCSGCEQCCTKNCSGCAYCYENHNDYVGMGWVDSQGRP